MGFALPPSLSNALKYTGDQIADIPGTENPRAPTIRDRNYPLFTLWRNSNKQATLPDAEGDMWYLARFDASVNSPPDAIWIKLSSGLVPGGTIISLSDTANTKVYPDGAGNIKLTQGAGISVVSTPATNLLTISINGATVGSTITGDTGGALSPVAGNWNIVGGPGITTTGAGNTLTINSVVYTTRGVNAVLESDSGTFANAAITLTLPAAPSQGELIEVVCTNAGPIVIAANVGQTIRINQNASSVAGLATNSALGDSLSLRYMSTGALWWTTSQIGLWTLS